MSSSHVRVLAIPSLLPELRRLRRKEGWGRKGSEDAGEQFKGPGGSGGGRARSGRGSSDEDKL